MTLLICFLILAYMQIFPNLLPSGYRTTTRQQEQSTFDPHHSAQQLACHVQILQSGRRQGRFCTTPHKCKAWCSPFAMSPTTHAERRHMTCLIRSNYLIYYFISKLVSLLIFLFIFNYLFYLKNYHIFYYDLFY
jgi:hypothetical protein